MRKLEATELRQATPQATLLTQTANFFKKPIALEIVWTAIMSKGEEKVRVGNRLDSYHVEGEERFEIFVAHTNTEGCLATRSGVFHVLLDVPSLISCLYKRLHLGDSISFNLYMLATIEQRVCLTDPLCR